MSVSTNRGPAVYRAGDKPLAIDLFCGLGGWTDGLLAEGYDVIGFDIERHEYGDERYPARLVIQDVLTLHGSQFREAALIVASPPCQAYSYREMPWKRAKALPPPDNSLFEACFRIQREACEAAGHHIPLVVENVRGAQPWVGRSRWNFGSFHLWGDVPALMPPKTKAGGHKQPGLSGPRARLRRCVVPGRCRTPRIEVASAQARKRDDREDPAAAVKAHRSRVPPRIHSGVTMYRLTKLAADGTDLPADATGHKAVRLRHHLLATPIVWTSFHSPKELNWKQAAKYADKLDTNGWSWRLPTVEEALFLPNRAKYPVLDKKYFPDFAGYEWIWTSTVDAESPAIYALGVNLGYGCLANRDFQTVGFRVRAVRVGPP